ncbi:hypothetical protein [Streptomyces sp. NBRC 110028]|uniref:hypothetical protein n=1 Tax=Streptomyces sp. NBRC 110028 TaxID=1621260 RepID=UPI000A93E0AA|nr:hypothetical protein [Streptomyces sp. NBRC 110028]
MKSEAALAFTGGYLFGRGHKVGLALTLAGMAAGRRLASGHLPGGMQELASSEIGRLRGQLVSAGRSAALSAASHRMDALSDRLEERAASLRPNGHGPDEHKADDEEHERRGGGGRSRDESSRGGSSRGDRGERTRPSGDRTDRPRKRTASEGGRSGRGDKGDKGDR